MATTAAETRELLDELKKGRVRFLLLQFTDLLGVNKAVEVPASRFERAGKVGFTMRVGCEVEFFIFEQSDRGEPTTRTLDAGSYFDLIPVDRGERARRVIVAGLEEMKLSSEASHHEVARGQHEIDL